MSEIKTNMVAPPEGVVGEGFFATKLNDVVGLARANSLWPLPFATSCCGIEFMATMASHYDLARFGSERVSFSPRQADMLMVMGTISKKMAPILRQVYEQMSEPRWVIAVGACASSGGIFDTYSVLQGIDRVDGKLGGGGEDKSVHTRRIPTRPLEGDAVDDEPTAELAARRLQEIDAEVLRGREHIGAA